MNTLRITRGILNADAKAALKATAKQLDEIAHQLTKASDRRADSENCIDKICAIRNTLEGMTK